MRNPVVKGNLTVIIASMFDSGRISTIQIEQNPANKNNIFILGLGTRNKKTGKRSVISKVEYSLITNAPVRYPHVSSYTPRQHSSGIKRTLGKRISVSRKEKRLARVNHDFSTQFGAFVELAKMKEKSDKEE